MHVWFWVAILATYVNKIALARAIERNSSGSSDILLVKEEDLFFSLCYHCIVTEILTG